MFFGLSLVVTTICVVAYRAIVFSVGFVALCLYIALPIYILDMLSNH